MMDFVENVKTAVTNTAQTVVKKSNELVELSKQKYAVYDLKNDIKKLYAEIGQLIYEGLHNGEEMSEEVRIKCEIIDAKKAKISALEAMMNHAEGRATCPSCGQDCRADVNFCPHCGAHMTVEVHAEVNPDYEADIFEEDEGENQ